jgi:hypothetical protein
MKTICYFDKDGNLINIGDWEFQTSTNNVGETVVGNPLPEGVYTEEREVFADEDGGRYIAKDPLAEAEKWIAKNFTIARLLQMKVWWDELPHENTPKLSAVYQWTNSVTGAAFGGVTNFDPPPHTFQELVAECVALT